MTMQMRHPYANDGTPLIPRYTAYAETVAPRERELRERAAADAAAGLARLVQISAQQEFDAAKARLEAARERVDAVDTAHLTVWVRHWQHRVAP